VLTVSLQSSPSLSQSKSPRTITQGHNPTWIDGYVLSLLRYVLFILFALASWHGIPNAPLYVASKHAILGVMRSLYIGNTLEGIRIASIHPFFAGLSLPHLNLSIYMFNRMSTSDTGILPVAAKVFLSGIPMTPVSRIAGAIFYAATDTDMETSGSAWLLPDNGPVFRVGKEEFKLGVYHMIDHRRNALFK